MDRVTRTPGERHRPGDRGREVGRVAGLWRYPVKSMAGEPLGAAEVSWHGVSGDRRWAFVRDGLQRSGFPYLTIRERPEMARYRPELVEPSRPDHSPAVVHTPAGGALAVDDPALLDELGGRARLLKLDRGLFDAAPLSLITTRTIADLGGLVGAALDVRRFRANLLVEPSGDDAYPEDGWVGATLRLGSVRMRVDRRDQRCVVVNVDPETTERDPAVLRAIARNREACLGVYGTVVAPGAARGGDPVLLEPPVARGD